MTGHPEIGHKTCQHRHYRMTCDDLRHLVSRASKRCEMCMRRARQTRHGQLYIDHDEKLGYWAVRGLLCATCNSALGVPSQRAKLVGASSYLSQPWVNERHGALALVPDEPCSSAGVIAGNRRFVRVDTGWLPRDGYDEFVISWESITRRWAPFQIKVVK